MQKRTLAKLILKIFVSTALMLFLVRKISTPHVKIILASLNGWTLFLAGVIFFCSNLLGSLQWHLLLRASGVLLPFNKTFRFYFVGLFFNNFLPANIGGDAVKVYDVSRFGNSIYQVIAVTVLDRLLGIFSLSLLATVAVVTLYRLSPGASLLVYLAIFLGCMLPGLGLYMFKPLGRMLRRVVLSIRIFSIDERVSKIIDYLSEFKGQKPLVAKLVLLSIFIQCLRILTHIVVGMSLGLVFSSSNIVQLFVFIPILSLAMIPPITINGLGVREGLGMVLFTAVGIQKTDAFLMEFITYFVSVLISFLGWLFFMTRRPAGKETASKVF